MNYRVRLNYCLNVEASSAGAARQIAHRLIKEQPGLAIRKVESEQLPSFWKMLLFGA